MPDWYNLHAALPASCGSKATNLSRLIKAGVTVPRGVVIIHSASVDNELITQATHTLAYPLIVRSSSSVEDTPLSSFAGVFRSSMAANAAAVAKALQNIDHHTASASVRQLLAEHNLPLENVRVSYVLQEYKRSRRGGVMIVPALPDQLIRIEQGTSPEKITAGKETPTSFELDPHKQAEIGEKWLRGLLKAVTIIRANFDGDQDVEWLEDETGTIYILQTRPYVQKPAAEKVIAEEQQRLSTTALHSGGYESDKLPDIDFPTPLTLSLLQKIYGHGTKQTFGLNQKLDDTRLFPIIAGQLYFDTVALKTLTKPAILKPSCSSRALMYRLGLLAGSLHYRHAPSESSGITELADDINGLYYQVKHQIGPNIFRVSDQLQIVRRQLQKKLQIEESSNLLRDLSKTPLQHAAAELSDAELLEQFGYLSGNEYELSAKRFSEQGLIGIESLRHLAEVATHRQNVTRNRDEALAGYISVFDTAYRKNLFNIYDNLQQEKANLHDHLIHAFAKLRQCLLELDSEHQLYNLIWYATIDEILQGRVLPATELAQRRNSWQLLQSTPLPHPNELARWSELKPVKPTAAVSIIDGTELSPGYANGKVCDTISSLPAGKKSILVTKSLSHEIILTKDRLAGVVTERGGSLSHVALLAREHGLPIIRTEEATKVILSGDTITIDTETGAISLNR
jgi:phosphohistidine swiveling domain-containing protein